MDLSGSYRKAGIAVLSARPEIPLFEPGQIRGVAERRMRSPEQSASLPRVSRETFAVLRSRTSPDRSWNTRPSTFAGTSGAWAIRSFVASRSITRTLHGAGATAHFIIRETQYDPFTGIAKPAPLQHELSGWPRHIGQEHRLVYQVQCGKIRILACRYHY